MFEINEEIQVLDQTCAVWRDGVVLQIEDNEYKVHFKSFTNKYDGFYSKGE
jgi:hypothetical protein